MKQRRESMSSKRLDLVQCNETQPLLHLLPWVHQKRNPIGRDPRGKAIKPDISSAFGIEAIVVLHERSRHAVRTGSIEIMHVLCRCCVMYATSVDVAGLYANPKPSLPSLIASSSCDRSFS
jgi:hypothetical protein